MLENMTKQEFIEAVTQGKFVVIPRTSTYYDVYMMRYLQDVFYPEGRFFLTRIVNPNTKSGSFRMTGGNYNKAMACIEQIASYINQFASDKDECDIDCLKFFQEYQRYHEIWR